MSFVALALIAATAGADCTKLQDGRTWCDTGDVQTLYASDGSYVRIFGTSTFVRAADGSVTLTMDDGRTLSRPAPIPTRRLHRWNWRRAG